MMLCARSYQDSNRVQNPAVAFDFDVGSRGFEDAKDKHGKSKPGKKTGFDYEQFLSQAEEVAGTLTCHQLEELKSRLRRIYKSMYVR